MRIHLLLIDPRPSDHILDLDNGKPWPSRASPYHRGPRYISRDFIAVVKEGMTAREFFDQVAGIREDPGLWLIRVNDKGINAEDILHDNDIYVLRRGTIFAD